VAERLGVKPARISYESTGKRHRMTISDIAELDISAVDGRDGSVVTIGNLPVGLHTSDTRVVAKSNRLTYRDLGFNWSLSGKNGNYSTFVYSPT